MLVCINCSKKYKPVRGSIGKYCGTKCQRDFEYLQYIRRWKLGLEVGYRGKTKQISNYIRKYLLHKYKNSCQECTWNDIHPISLKPLVQIHHINGDAGNCKEENLKVLCPNCHSKTSNYGARNKNSSRIR